MQLNPEVRQRVKQSSVVALGSQHVPVRLAAAQVIAKIATIELPKPGQWDDLMQTLLDYVVKPEASPAGGLETYFVCVLLRRHRSRLRTW